MCVFVIISIFYSNKIKDNEYKLIESDKTTISLCMYGKKDLFVIG